MSKYLFLLWQDENKRETPGTPAFDKEMAAYGAMFEQASGAGILQGGDPLQPASAGQTVRVHNGSTDATAGTFSSTSEQLIGFYVLDCKDATDAASWAAKIPAAAKGAIEVRPILVM
ncbi:MAG: YciI family protein [Candidatus Dormibacter sp.]